MQRPYISVVICVYNEAGNCHPMLARLQTALAGYDYELIYVNDGSTDQTLAELLSAHHSNLTVIDLQKNYGQSTALAAGIEAARGIFIVTMDGDGQNDPLDIMPMVEAAEARDLDLVVGIRQQRQDNTLLRKWPSQLANALIRQTTGLPIRDNGCALKIFRAETAKRIGLYGELHRFVSILAHLDGARIGQVPVRHHARQIGQSKYGIGRTGRVVLDLLLVLFMKRYLQKPMHLFGGMGMLVMLCGLLLTARTAWIPHAETRWLAELATDGMWVLAGLQFLAIGLVLDLQMRTYYEAQGKKPYIVRKTYREPNPTWVVVRHVPGQVRSEDC